MTFLAAHALPPDRWARTGAYAKQVAEWCEDAYLAGARFCDVFCDQGYFSVPQSRSILKAGLAAKLIPRIHADELARTGGARLAAELHAASADHLLRANRGDAVALARAGVVATLAPGTALSIGKLPPVKELIDTGTVIALGTDHNPGTSGITSMSASAPCWQPLSVAPTRFRAQTGAWWRLTSWRTSSCGRPTMRGPSPGLTASNPGSCGSEARKFLREKMLLNACNRPISCT